MELSWKENSIEFEFPWKKALFIDEKSIHELF